MQNRIRLEHKGRDMANHCKVFTTSAYAKELLDAADYRCGLFGRRVLENSCGDGHILMEIVRRYISDCIDREMPLSLIKNGLERDITGYELEREHYENCIRNLNETAAEYKRYQVGHSSVRCVTFRQRKILLCAGKSSLYYIQGSGE